MIENTESNVVSINRPRQNSEINFKVFAKLIMKSDTKGATRILRDLLHLDYVTSEKMTSFISLNFDKDPHHLMKLVDFRTLLENGSQNEILAFVQEVFGVTGHVSIYIFTKLTTHFQKEV